MRETVLKAVLIGAALVAAAFAGSKAFAQTSGPQARPEALTPFTLALRDRQPEESFAAVYRVGDAHLVWLAARHSTRTDSLTFALIEQAYAAFAFDSVILEGCPAAWGPTPERLVAYAEAGAAEEADGFQPRGETVPTVLGGLAQGATLYCGEPADAVVRDSVLSQGFSEADILGFYTLRSIPQWIRQQRVKDGADPALDALLSEELARNRARLDLSGEVLADLPDWKAWYRDLNGRPLDARFSTEEAGPAQDGRFASNRIGAAVSKARAAHLHQSVIDQLAMGESVMVRFGASHFMIHAPALTASLGAPCYTGAEPGAARQPCEME